jgi:F-type H+-transporting ATPase subunit b
MNINATLIGQTITFFVFVWFCRQYIWPLLTTAMRERQEAIAEGLAASERAEHNLEQARARAAEELREAKAEAQQIIEQARKRATAMVEEAKDVAREEGERIKESARSEIEQELNRAKEALRGQVAGLAVSGAEKILRSSIDQSRHGELLERLAAEL